jgi:hypothetical protein
MPADAGAGLDRGSTLCFCVPFIYFIVVYRTAVNEDDWYKIQPLKTHPLKATVKLIRKSYKHM